MKIRVRKLLRIRTQIAGRVLVKKSAKTLRRFGKSEAIRSKIKVKQ